jgi:hypothetical protein
MPSADPTERERAMAIELNRELGSFMTDHGREGEIADRLAQHRCELRADPAFIMPAAMALLKDVGVHGLTLHFKFPKFRGESYVARGMQSLLQAYRSVRRMKEQDDA